MALLPLLSLASTHSPPPTRPPHTSSPRLRELKAARPLCTVGSFSSSLSSFIFVCFWNSTYILFLAIPFALNTSFFHLGSFVSLISELAPLTIPLCVGGGSFPHLFLPRFTYQNIRTKLRTPSGQTCTGVLIIDRHIIHIVDFYFPFFFTIQRAPTELKKTGATQTKKIRFRQTILRRHMSGRADHSRGGGGASGRAAAA